MTMFKPKYSITNKLSVNIRKIGEIIGELNGRHFPDTVLASLERDARILSSHSSTSIEGNPLPLTDVKRILKSTPENIRDSEREVLNYNEALLYIHKKLKEKQSLKIDNRLICQIQGKVMYKLPGKNIYLRYRSEPVFVNNPIRRETVYLPPDAKDVQPMMNDLVEFIEKGKDVIDPLIIAGIFHKQFVIIHPFIDGNGRTVRIITKAILAQLGIDTFQLFSFENYYNNNVSKYYTNVGVFGNYYDIKDKTDFTEWLEYFTEGILDELNRVKALLPQYMVRLEPHHKGIIKYIEKHGSITAREYAKITDRAKATRIKDFKKLIKMKIIKPVGVGKATYYVLEDRNSNSTIL
jgi:Fic family protein